MTKVISVPKNKQAMIDLYHNIASDHQLIEWTLSEQEFKEFKKLQLISFINSICNTLIDDFEDDKIEGDLSNKH